MYSKKLNLYLQKSKKETITGEQKIGPLLQEIQ